MQKRFEKMEDGKRRNLSLNDVVREYGEVFDNLDTEIKYCKLGKCRIETESGKKILKKVR